MEIRKAKHLDRVARTKIMSKYLDKTSPSPVKTHNYFNLNVSDQTTMTKNKDEFVNNQQNSNKDECESQLQKELQKCSRRASAAYDQEILVNKNLQDLIKSLQNSERLSQASKTKEPLQEKRQ